MNINMLALFDNGWRSAGFLPWIIGGISLAPFVTWFAVWLFMKWFQFNDKVESFEADRTKND